MAELRYNNEGGYLGAALTSSGTTITFASAPNFATLSGGNYIKLALDAGTSSFEIVYLTAYTSAATTGTITRAAEDSTNWPATSHSSGTGSWACVPTVQDYPGGSTASPWLEHVSYSGPDGYGVGSTLTAVDTTNATILFTAPPSGTVVVTVSVAGLIASSATLSDTSSLYLAFLDHTTSAQVAPIEMMVVTNCVVSGQYSRSGGRLFYCATVSGLTPGVSYQWDLAAQWDTEPASCGLYVDDGSASGDVGPLEMFVYAG